MDISSTLNQCESQVQRIYQFLLFIYKEIRIFSDNSILIKAEEVNTSLETNLSFGSARTSESKHQKSSLRVLTNMIQTAMKC